MAEVPGRRGMAPIYSNQAGVKGLRPSFCAGCRLYVTGEIQETIPTTYSSRAAYDGPNAPFSINNDSSRCPSNQRPAAQSMLNALNSYFAKPETFAGTPEPW